MGTKDTLEIGRTVDLYSLTARGAFSGSRYSVKSLESLEKLPSLSNNKVGTQGLDRPPEPVPFGNQS